MVFDRTQHQPRHESPQHDQPTASELKRFCGQTAALVLAFDSGTAPLKVRFEDNREEKVCESERPLARPLQIYEGKTLVARACETAALAFPAVGVLIGGNDATQATLRSEVDAASARTGLPLRRLAYDALQDAQATRAAAGFTLNDITKGVLDSAFSLLQGEPSLDSVVLLSCDQVRVTPWHLLQVCKAFREDPKLDLSASWIERLRRTPLVISRALLEKINDGSLTQIQPFGDRVVPSLRVAETLFGEERLAATATVPHGVERFLESLTLSAREALRIAQAEMAHRENSTAPGSAKQGRSAADELLVTIARETLEEGATRGSAKEQSAVRRADAWGTRNRQDFPLLTNPQHCDTLAYLDSAATTQRVRAAILAQMEFDTAGNANIYRGSYDLSARSTEQYNQARQTLAAFIGAEEGETVFTMNASASANLVAQAWGEWNIGKGDLIVSTIEEHHSNMVPWLMLAKRKGAQLDYIPVLGDGRLDLNAYDELLKQRPKLVCATHISNVFGIENPLRDMARKAHAAGARFYADAAQSLPHLPLRVSEIGVDFAGFSAHKMYGPFGIGGLWISPEAFDEMSPTAGGGGTFSHVGQQTYYLRDGAAQYEVGTPPISQAIGWAAAAQYLETLGFDAIQEHSAVLTRYLVDGLHAIDGLTVWGDHTKPDGQTGLVSFTLAGIVPSQMGAFCGKLGVALRTGGHCAVPLSAAMGVTGTGRASIAVHTTKEDVDALLCALRACRRVYYEAWTEQA